MRHTRLAPLALLMVCATAFAHHGWSSYDADKVLELTGSIESASYENPHGMATLKTDDATWKVVLAPPSRMQNRGLSRDMLVPGTVVTVEGYPHKEDAAELRAERITVNGKTVELR